MQLIDDNGARLSHTVEDIVTSKGVPRGEVAEALRLVSFLRKPNPNLIQTN